MDPSSLKMKEVDSGTGSGDGPTSSDDDVVEIPPPPSSNTSNKKLKQKQVISPEEIDFDYDEDFNLDEDNFPHSSNGKGSQNSFFSSHNIEFPGTVNLSKDVGPISHNISAADTSGNNSSYLEDYYEDLNNNKIIYDNECALLQAPLDNVDVPSRIEAPWWPSSKSIEHQDVPGSSWFINAGTSRTNGSESLTKKKEDPQFSQTYYYKESLQSQLIAGSPSYAEQDSNPASAYSAASLPGWNVPFAEFPIPKPILYLGLSKYADTVKLDRGIVAEISDPADLGSSLEQGDREALILNKLKSFKQFDMVQDHFDHRYYFTEPYLLTNDWIKNIQDEWRMLVKALPDTIFVRVYERRMDLLRAVIIGAQGTPYHDGIFFFDVQFTADYPTLPPKVFYRSGGLKINPNLYHNGDLCLSLLNTWMGEGNEKWVPGSSTILQVLVSLQGLVLNAEPLYNEPANQVIEGLAEGELESVAYNENAFLLSLHTMLYSMRHPPENFEDFVFGHFYKRAHEILIACKSYLGGAQVGTLVEGGIQDVDVGDKSCSYLFKVHLTGYINTLVQAFTKIGIKDCEKYTVRDLLYEYECKIMQPPPPGC